MEDRHEREDPAPLDDDPVLEAAFVAEVERIVGPLDQLGNQPRFQWLLPVSGLAELLATLRDAPTGAGLTGLERFLRDRLGTLSGMKAVQEEDDDSEADV